MKHFLARAICLILVPILIYSLLFLIHLKVLNKRYWLDRFIQWLLWCIHSFIICIIYCNPYAWLSLLILSLWKYLKICLIFTFNKLFSILDSFGLVVKVMDSIVPHFKLLCKEMTFTMPSCQHVIHLLIWYEFLN